MIFINILENNTLLDNIYVIRRRRNFWVAELHFYSTGKINIENTVITQILLKKRNFIKIDSHCVINLNFVRECTFTDDDCIIVVKDITYDVSPIYQSYVKDAYQKFLKRKYQKVTNTLQFDDLSLKKLNPQNILYLKRVGNKTVIFYRDQPQINIYQTLGYLLNKLNKESNFFFQIRRNVIVNVQYIQSFEVLETNPKLGEITIDNTTFTIARRILPNFKRLFQ